MNEQQKAKRVAREGTDRQMNIYFKGLYGDDTDQIGKSVEDVLSLMYPANVPDSMWAIADTRSKIERQRYFMAEFEGRISGIAFNISEHEAELARLLEGATA